MSKDHQKKCEKCAAPGTLTKYKGQLLCRSCLCGDETGQAPFSMVKSSFGRSVQLANIGNYLAYHTPVPLSFGIPNIGE